MVVVSWLFVVHCLYSNGGFESRQNSNKPLCNVTLQMHTRLIPVGDM